MVTDDQRLGWELRDAFNDLSKIDLGMLHRYAMNTEDDRRRAADHWSEFLYRHLPTIERAADRLDPPPVSGATMPRKQSSERLSKLAARVLQPSYPSSRDDVIADAKLLAGSVLSQDETASNKECAVATKTKSTKKAPAARKAAPSKAKSMKGKARKGKC